MIVKGPGGRRLISKFEAALTQQANKAASGDPRAFREILRLRERVQEQEPFLSPPNFVVNFIRPRNTKPGPNKDGGE